MMITATIRQQTAADIRAILAIQAACYPADFIESAAALQRKQQIAPTSAWLIELNGKVLGYLFAHPWQGDTPPALDQILPQLPAAADRFYIHDLAIDPTARGKKLAEQLIQHAMQWARQAQYSQAMLTAVLGAEAFWHKHQFQTLTRPLCVNYGPAALCMLRRPI